MFYSSTPTLPHHVMTFLFAVPHHEHVCYFFSYCATMAHHLLLLLCNILYLPCPCTMSITQYLLLLLLCHIIGWPPMLAPHNPERSPSRKTRQNAETCSKLMLNPFLKFAKAFKNTLYFRKSGGPMLGAIKKVVRAWLPRRRPFLGLLKPQD